MGVGVGVGVVGMFITLALVKFEGVVGMFITLALVKFEGVIHTEATDLHASCSGKDEVLAYWHRELEGASMPSSLRGMITPLNAQQATELRTQILQRGFLPAHAAAFCRATASPCDRASFLISPQSPAQFPRYLTVASKLTRPPAAFTTKLPSGSFFRQNQTLAVGARIPWPSVDNNGAETTQVRAFLPRELAHLFPMSGERASLKVSRMFNIGSATQANMKETVLLCSQEVKEPTEVKACHASIESIVDFASTLITTKPITVLDASKLASVSKSSNTIRTITSVKAIKQDLSAKYVACHDMPFPFRVFYCHYLGQTRIFLATIQAQDGAIQNGVAICHYDTSFWDPSHVAFSDLNMKPGQTEACHWMGKSGIVFLHQNAS